MIRFAVVIAALVAASPLRAQVVRVDSSLIPKAPPPVTATRVDSAPAGRLWSTTVITADDLRRRGVVSLAAALRLVTGAYISEEGSVGSRTSLHLRGAEDDFVPILIDGIRISEPGGAADLAFVALDNIDRIEIVRGPLS